MADFNILVGVQSGDAIQKLANVEKGVKRVGTATNKTNAQLKAHANQYNKTAVATNKWAKGALQQAGYQIGDFAVQVQGGTNALQAFGQQGSQLLGIFGPIGAILGAGIAIFAAVGTAIMKSSGSVKELSEELDEASDAIDKLRGSIENSFNPLSHIDDRFGSFAKNVKNLSEAQKNLNFGRAASEILQTSEALNEFVDLSFFTDRIMRFELGMQDLGTAARKLQKDFDLIEKDSFDVARGFSAIARAEGIEGKAQAISDLHQIISTMVPTTNKGEIALAALGDQLAQGALTAYEYLAALEEVTGGLDDAASASEKLGKTTLSIVEAQYMLKKGILPPGAADDFKVVNKEIEKVYENLRRAARTPEKTIKKAREEIIKISPEMKQLIKLSEDIGKKFETAFMDVVRGTSSVKDAFRTMAADIIAELYRVFVVKKITGFITDAVGLFMGPAPGSSGSLTTRAVGGPVSAGQPYLVGERGPELMIPSSNGKIIPNNHLGGGGSVIVNQTINVSTGVQQTVRTEIKSLMPQIAESAKAAVADAKRRGGSYGRAFA